MQARKTKAALIRAEGYPVGRSAPMHVRCSCGARPLAPEADSNVICACGIQYDAHGWIVQAVQS